MQVKVKCPAKINLTLEVLDKRADGFHNIKSVMQAIDLYDFLKVTLTPSEKFEIKLTGNSNEIPYDEKNLCYKAADLFLKTVKVQPHIVSIDIEKNIPVAAGLAGGSTDAVGVLVALNKLLDSPLSKKDLHVLCANLGSDLNFCIDGGRQLATGRGENLEPQTVQNFRLSLIKPLTLGISAKEAYTKFALRGKRGFVNDLEGAVIDDYQELQKIKSLYPNAIMSGSGSTYFLIEEDINPIEGFWVRNGLSAIKHGVEII